MTVSNVRGPDQAMYLAGARAMCLYPVSIPADGAGLNFTGVSYNGVMWVSMVSCRRHGAGPRAMHAMHARVVGGTAGRGRRPAGSRQAAAAARRSPACAQALEIRALNRGWLPRLSRIGPSGRDREPRNVEFKQTRPARLPHPLPDALGLRRGMAASMSSERCTSQSVNGMACRACVLPA